MIRATAFSLALCALGAHGAEKPAWEFSTKASGQRVASVKVHGSAEATLSFSRHRDADRKPVSKGGVTTPPLALELWLADSAKIRTGFDFNDYEGPDAISGSTKLVTVTLTSKGKPWTRKFTASGWFGAVRGPADDAQRAQGEPEVFIFGIGNVIKDYRDLVQLADSLAAGADALKIDLAGAKKGAKGLSFDIPLAGASEVMKQLLATKR